MYWESDWTNAAPLKIEMFWIVFKSKLSAVFSKISSYFVLYLFFLGCHKIVLWCPSLLLFWYAKRTDIAAWQIDVPKNDSLITDLNKVPSWTGNIDHMWSPQGNIVENKIWFVLLEQDFVFCRNLPSNFWGTRLVVLLLGKLRPFNRPLQCY